MKVQHEIWVEQYKKVRKAIGIDWPGYMIHESGAWSAHHNRWFFLPRRCSFESYNETKDESKGCNYLITADPSFSEIKVVTVRNITKYILNLIKFHFKLLFNHFRLEIHYLLMVFHLLNSFREVTMML